VLHSFYVVSTAVMLVWHRLYAGRKAHQQQPEEPLGCRA
jgi:hypothetical protein